MPRSIALSLALLCALSWGSLAAADAGAATRAVLQWDTDDTDIDLHVWDGYGNHASYADKEALSTGVLSQDILYGFGPEDYRETYYESLSEGEPLYFGVCYYRSHWADESIPATTVTLTISDPDGTVRVVRRVLRAEKESFLLGSSPTGSVPPPTEAFCGDRAARPEADAGDPTPGAEISAAACTDTSRRIGAVVICGDTITGSGSRYAMSGNVRVNGSVGLGNGPVAIDTGAGTITTTAPVDVTVQRPTGAVQLGTARIVIDTASKTDPVSGRTGLAKITLAVPALLPLTVGALPSTLTDAVGATLPAGGALSGYLDTRDGGGIILSGTVALDFAPGTPSSALAIGIHRTSKAPARVLGGSAKFDALALPGSPWKASLGLTYNADADQWDASGALDAKVIGLEVEGRVIGGKLDGIGVKVSRDVPLGNTGFILSSVRGRVDGITAPPMKVTAGVTGKWGAIPGVDAGVVMLDDASLSFSTDLSASVNGAVSFGVRNGPVKGSANLAGRLEPFGIDGTMSVGAHFKDVLTVAGSGAGHLTKDRFSLLEKVRGEVLGRSVASARLGLSNTGLGAVGQLCVPVPFKACHRMDVGASMRWNRFGRFSFGGDALGQIGIRSGATGRRLLAGPAGIDAEGTEPMLVWQADGAIAEARVNGPGSAGCRAGRSTQFCSVTFDPATNVTTAFVFSPRRGRWALESSAPLVNPSVEKAQAIPRIGRPTLVTAGSRNRPLARTAKRVAIGWTSTGPSTKRVRIDVYLAATKGHPGTLLRADRKARGSVKVRRSDVAAGGQFVRLVVKVDGQPASELWSKKAIWVR